MTLFEYKWGKTRFEITGKDEKTPYEIIVKYNNGKEIKAIDNHGNADLDIVTGTDKNGNEVFTYPSTADAQSQQGLLSGAPGSDIEKTVANYVADGSVIPLNHLIIDNPQTPEQVAVAVISAIDNVDTDGIEPYMKLISDEYKNKHDQDTEAYYKMHPDFESMTISAIVPRENHGEIVGSVILGEINTNGQKFDYRIKTNLPSEGLKIDSVSITD